MSNKKQISLQSEKTFFFRICFIN